MIYILTGITKRSKRILYINLVLYISYIVKKYYIKVIYYQVLPLLNTLFIYEISNWFNYETSSLYADTIEFINQLFHRALNECKFISYSFGILGLWSSNGSIVINSYKLIWIIDHLHSCTNPHFLIHFKFQYLSATGLHN